MQEDCDCKKTNQCRKCKEQVCVKLSKYPHAIHTKLHKDDCSSGRFYRKKSAKKIEVTEEEINRHEEKPVRGKKSSSEQAKKIQKKRKKEDNEGTSSTEQPCKVKKASIFEDWQKHIPEVPEGATETQVEVLRKIAVSRVNCTCFAGEDITLNTLCYDTQKKAKEVILEQVKLFESKNSELCSAFSILEKNGQYLVLETNSCHSKAEASITNNDSVKKIRPAVEPSKKDILFPINNKTHVVYGFSSCNVCCNHKTDNAIVFDVPEESLKKTPFREHLISRLNENALVPFPKERDKRVTFSDNTLHALVTKRFKGKKSQIVFAEQIQPPGCTEQEGWSLHHSEIECVIFAKRRGWNIVAIYIDRDCCPVCASSLNTFDQNAYNAIKSFYTLKEELEPTKKPQEKEEDEDMNSTED